MLSASSPTPPPPPPPVRTDTRLIEPDEQWKADQRRRIEHNLRHMVEDAQNVRDTILNSQPSESSRENAHREYEESMNTIRMLAQDEFNHQLRTEMLEREWALDVVDSNSPDVVWQQWIGEIRKSNEERTPFGPSDAPQTAEDHEDEDAGDFPAHAHPARRCESQPYSPGGAAPRRQNSGTQAPVWRPVPRAPEPSGISRTLAHANGQMYATGPVQFPRRGSVNSTGSNSSGAGLHRAGSLNSDQHRSSSVAPHNGTERPSTQARDRIASNVGSRERQTSASASPHERPSPPSFSTVAPRAIPGAPPPPLDDVVRFPTSGSPSSRAIFALQRLPEDIGQGIAIPRGPTTPEEGLRGTLWSSLHSFGDFNAYQRHNSKGDSRLPPVDGDLFDTSYGIVGQLDDRQHVRSMWSVELEQMAARNSTLGNRGALQGGRDDSKGIGGE